ncbi:WD repeat-containing protein 91 [Folsomia candida]|uniref:WD repeat-containing protein 91 n=1 Tax=Folsomia candida TaxID=158441 RepID=A0A226EU34_FOLCA|nr:WD repeat-containing protein 91 [Folsomia candida]OXA61123.1 WD repeat-containing protein 91 [Folsomia candida]
MATAMPKGVFSVDRIVSDLAVFIDSSDLHSLRELWSYLEGKFFSRLAPTHSSVVKKYEFGLYKFYLVEALKAGRKDKLSEFFEKMATELNPYPEWKEWYLIGYIKNPEDHSTASTYSNKNYREAFFVSIRNFLTVIYHRTWTVAEVSPKNPYSIEIMDDFFSIAQPKLG